MPGTPIPFELEDGTIVYVEDTDPRPAGPQRAGRGSPEEKTAKRFTRALAHIRPAAETVLNAFKEMNTPDEIGLEFGVKFSGELGTAIIASAKGEATFKVSLKWTNPKPAVAGAEPVKSEAAG